MPDAVVIDGEDIPLTQESDTVTVQHRAAFWSRRLGLSTFRATRLITAASDIARNTIIHGGGGRLRIDLRDDATLRMTFADQGPGIARLEDALRDGYSTRGGLGLGLPGARRLVDAFAIDTTVGQGTTVTLVMRRR